MKELLQDLIRAESTCHTGELAAANVIADFLQSHNIPAQLDTWDENRANITAHIKGSGDQPGLLFACHLDVVPPGEAEWQYPPFEAVEADGKIFGRGAADMKGSTAALLTAMAQLVDSNTELHGDIIFTSTAGEETDSCGAKRYIERYKDSLPDLQGIVIAEPTNFEVITAHRGLLWLEIITKGKTAHGSMPQHGVNAINSMRKFLDKLDTFQLSKEIHPQLGNCSVSINTIDAGKAINVVPDRCSTKLDIRTIPSVNNSDIIADIVDIFAELKKADPDFDSQVNIIRNVAALHTDINLPFVKNFCKVVDVENTITAGYCTDGPFFKTLNSPVVIYGPGHDELCHKPDEYIEIYDLEIAVEKFKSIIKTYLC